MSLNELVKKVRLSREHSLRDLAEESGISTTHLWEIEQGNRGLSRDAAEALSEALDEEQVLLEYFVEKIESHGFTREVAELAVALHQLEGRQRDEAMERTWRQLEEIEVHPLLPQR